MKKVTIVRECTFTHQDHSRQIFPVGTHELDDSLADHWWIKAHSDNPPVSEPVVGTPEYAQAQARIIARKRLLDEAVEQEAQDAKINVGIKRRSLSNDAP